MNMQALMKQAQAMQKDISNIKQKIDESSFVGSSSMVTVTVNGKKEVLSVVISDDAKDLIADDLSMLSDMILIAINDANRKVDEELEKKMGKYSNMMPGMF